MEDDAGLPTMVEQWPHIVAHNGPGQYAQRAKHCREHCKHLLNFGRSIALSNAQRCLKHQHFH